jgi:hypothetical protein
VDEVGLIDMVGRWNSSLNINLTPVVDDEDRLPFGQLSRCRPAPAPAVLQIRVSKKIG